LNNPGTSDNLSVSNQEQGMRRLFLFVCGVALFSAAPVFVHRSLAQQTPAGKSPSAISLLPKQFRDWRQTTCSSAAAHFAYGKEAGEREVVACGYASGDKTIQIVVGQYKDPSSAYEIFTGQLKTGMMPTNLGQAAAFDKSGVFIQEGALVISSTANISREDLGSLVQAMEAKSNKSPLPPIRTFLPAAGRVLGTERYALGPEALKTALDGLGQTDTAGLVEAAGFSSGAEAMVAKYSSRGKDGGVLLLLEYPTPQLAEQHIHHLDEVLPEPAKQGGTGIERKGSLLALVLSASSPEYAKRLREDADYETHVTWNEPGQTATDPPWAVILKRIFIGTGIFMIAAIVLGIAFGGFRVVIKRLFPGKVFDRPERMEVLQLGLSGKRIDPSDFY
jgi:hypothetical protein